MGKHTLEYWKKIKELRCLKIDLNSIVKDNKEKEIETRKIIKLFLICINNKYILEGCCVLYNKNAIIRFGMSMVFKYYISTFNKYK
jgi:hypothetical protein